MEVRNKARGIAHDLDVAKITVVGVPDRPGIAASIFETLAKANVSVDTIVQNASINNITDLTFTVAKGDMERAMEVAKPVASAIGARPARRSGLSLIIVEGEIGGVHERCIHKNSAT